MAKYSIKAPDGNTYSIEGPEGATDEEVRLEVLRQNPTAAGSNPPVDLPNKPKQETTRGTGESLLRGAGQGVFGLGDEIEAAARSGLGMTGDYTAELTKARQANQEASKQSPLAYTAGDLGTSVATAFIPGLGIGGNALKGGAALANAARVGATQGALRGFGEGDGLGDRLTKGATGAAVGGAAGGATNLAARGIGAVGRGVDDIYAGIQNAGGNILSNLGRVGTMLNQAPGARKVAQDVTEGISNQLDNRVDVAIDGIRKNSPKLADWLGNMYNSKLVGGGPGLTGRGAAALATGGKSLGAEATVRGGAMAARAGGYIGSTPAGAAVAGQQSARASTSERVSMADVLRSPEVAINMASGTKYEKMLLDAQQMGPSRLKAVLFTLQANPEFRRTIGVTD